jgi:hypothetical protein
MPLRAHGFAIRRLAIVPIELLLQVRLSVGCFRERRHRNFELLAAKFAHCNGGSATQPLDDPKRAFWHGRLVSP